MSQAITDLQQKQIQQAEELFFSGPQKEGFAKDLYFGRFRQQSILPYPVPTPEERKIGDEAVKAVREFVEENIDAAEIDRNADIPQHVIQGLADVGVLGMCVSKENGGQGMSQQNYCRVMEVVGGHCAATGVFVNAHHSVGLRALELFGTEQQKARWMRPLVNGEQLAAFALTEPEAGSDAANVQTRATPKADGSGYILNGQKRYITHGSTAKCLTVMARTPDPSDPEGKVTAFLVTPDTPGFEVVEARMGKCGIRGTVTSRLAFHDMFVPTENILGPIGKGLRVALTVLDFGRTTFGACCTGGAKAALNKAIDYANRRRQFGSNIAEFEQVKQKIAYAAADTFAMESTTYHTAALIDSGAHDYMLETAMLKVFASDMLWRIVNDSLQIYGGAGYFTTEPLERMMRDARINTIGEGANDVLRSFIAMVGLRNVGKEMEEVKKKPWMVGKLHRGTPNVSAPHDLLAPEAVRLSKQIGAFGKACRSALFRYREGIIDRQLVQARLADTATELFVASCVFARLATLLSSNDGDEASRRRGAAAGLFYLKLAYRRNKARMAELKNNDDADLVKTANLWLAE